MKYITTIALALGFTAFTALADDKAKTLTGKIVCAKCTAKKAAKCSPAFVSKGKDGKTVTLLVKGKAAKAIKHGRICKPNSSVEVTITGLIKEGAITADKLAEKKKK
tara:strand:+ start:118 stop:438 length:321 start_codon:yes stop_codon:yes gene_type:complete